MRIQTIWGGRRFVVAIVAFLTFVGVGFSTLSWREEDTTALIYAAFWWSVLGWNAYWWLFRIALEVELEDDALIAFTAFGQRRVRFADIQETVEWWLTPRMRTIQVNDQPGIIVMINNNGQALIDELVRRSVLTSG